MGMLSALPANIMLRLDMLVVLYFLDYETLNYVIKSLIIFGLNIINTFTVVIYNILPLTT